MEEENHFKGHDHELANRYEVSKLSIPEVLSDLCIQPFNVSFHRAILKTTLLQFVLLFVFITQECISESLIV